jgi:hypothetical protein
MMSSTSAVGLSDCHYFHIIHCNIEMSQEERSIFWDVIVIVILIKECIRTCVLFRTVSEIELVHCAVHCTLYRRATRHITRVLKCTDADGGIFETVIILGKLYQLCHVNNKYRY